jgi:ribosome-binding factor A
LTISRPDRIADQLREELAQLISREVHDPGVGFLTITRVKVTPDLQTARVLYTTLGDEKARRDTAKALGRATPFLRRQIGQRLRLRRVPELEFFYDESIERADRIEQILHELEQERASRADDSPSPSHDDADDE